MTTKSLLKLYAALISRIFFIVIAKTQHKPRIVVLIVQVYAKPFPLCASPNLIGSPALA
jgi:hypothetical protein